MTKVKIAQQTRMVMGKMPHVTGHAENVTRKRVGRDGN